MLYITGITGHSGKWFLKRLEAEEYIGKIRCAMRESKESAPNKYALFDGCQLDIEFSVGDLSDEEFLTESLKGVETIVHIAGIPLSTKIVQAAIKNNVKWAILVHTTGRFSKYKSASEAYIKIDDKILSLRESIAVTILRPTMIYGSSGDRNMYRLVGYLSKHKVFPLFGDGRNLMQPVHARDLGNAYYDVLMHPNATKNKEYNLSGKDPITYLHIIQTIRDYLNSKVKIIKIPISLSIFAARAYNALFKNAIITVEQVMR
ncbi:MAG TPA: NAD-dependent epimerase/dehydratase family protein, partial [Anaerovoracaceae bacterium]|nr:NAD-dependent epimerase/dehydratase family protein [Anaerovoracaceae bacterium]